MDGGMRQMQRSRRGKRAAVAAFHFFEDYLPLDGSGEEAEFTSRNQVWAVSPGA